MLIPSLTPLKAKPDASLSRRVNANSQPSSKPSIVVIKLIKKGEC